MDKKYISKRIADLREQRQVTAREMSLSMGQADNYINNIENGKSCPSVQSFFHICEYLKVSPKDFFDEDSKAPGVFRDLSEILKPLDEAVLKHLLGFISTLTGKKE
ncbi:MAG: helix-turn-helix domain-containing protein [Eubacterium sp.]|jgi:transcriptional regulator with XRE-family HTH domain|nr:helix-turn-helix domain-containing protein [Eubacterium sp.]